MDKTEHMVKAQPQLNIRLQHNTAYKQFVENYKTKHDIFASGY